MLPMLRMTPERCLTISLPTACAYTCQLTRKLPQRGDVNR